MKIVLATMVLFAASFAQPSLAEELAAHHASRAEVSAAAKTTAGKNVKSGPRVPQRAGLGRTGKSVDATAGTEPTGRGASAVDARPDDTIDAGVTVLTPRGGVTPAKAGNTNANLKIAKPTTLQAHRSAIVQPANPVRNAIGQPLARPKIAPRRDAHFGATVQAPAAASGNSINLSGNSGGPNSARPKQHPVTTASIGNRGRVDGATLIRPAFATSGLGGPAKPVGGINGTTLRRKH